jgi:CO/xanthine dehydrogenase FAD-binding subunit
MVKNKITSYRPDTLAEALLHLNMEPLIIIAGGTDLMVKNRNWSTLAPNFKNDVIFISHLPELAYVFKDEEGIHIGSAMTLEELLHHDDVPTLLKDALKIMGSPAIRHMGTIGGNVGNASPAGDTLPVLYVLNAMITLASMDGKRSVSIEEFILGPGETSKKDNEVIKEIVIEDKEFDSIYYKKVGGRKTDSISKVCFVGCASVDAGKVVDFRVAFGAVGPTIVRKTVLEENFIGLLVEDVVDRVVTDYFGHIRPINDQRSNAIYRKQISMNLLEDFTKNLINN